MQAQNRTCLARNSPARQQTCPHGVYLVICPGFDIPVPLVAPTFDDTVPVSADRPPRSSQGVPPVDHAVWGGIQGLADRASRMASMGRRPWLRALTR